MYPRSYKYTIMNSLFSIGNQVKDYLVSNQNGRRLEHLFISGSGRPGFQVKLFECIPSRNWYGFMDTETFSLQTNHL